MKTVLNILFGGFLFVAIGCFFFIPVSIALAILGKISMNWLFFLGVMILWSVSGMIAISHVEAL